MHLIFEGRNSQLPGTTRQYDWHGDWTNKMYLITLYKIRSQALFVKKEKLTQCIDDSGAALSVIPDGQSQGTAYRRLNVQMVGGKLSLLLILQSVLLSSRMKVWQCGGRCPCWAQSHAEWQPSSTICIPLWRTVARSASLYAALYKRCFPTRTPLANSQFRGFQG